MELKRWFFNNSGEKPVNYTPNSRTRMSQACDSALARAEARRPTGSPAGQSRVVGMVWAGSGSDTWGDGEVNRDEFRALYNEWVAAGRPDVLSTLEPAKQANSYNLIKNGFNEAYNDLGPWSEDNGASAICIALNSSEGVDLTFTLNVATDKGTISTVGGTEAVFDTITTTADTTSTTPLNATIDLIVNGVGVSTAFTVPPNGVTQSPTFTPADFGWAKWPVGNYFYDFHVLK